MPKIGQVWLQGRVVLANVAAGDLYSVTASGRCVSDSSKEEIINYYYMLNMTDWWYLLRTSYWEDLKALTQLSMNVVID